MNNLLFTALIIALLYYFFYYLPSQKKLTANPPLKHNQFTQTELINDEPKAIEFPAHKSVIDTKELDNLKKAITQKEQTIIGLNSSYEKLETKTAEQIKLLTEKLNTMTYQLTQLQTHQTKDEQDLTKTLDELLKGIQDLNQEL
jgi:CRISPR/Cas system CSM-associated protein Csm2 small subunit